MKKLIFFISFYLLGLTLVIAQDIQIELKLFWKQQENFINIGNVRDKPIVQVPFLSVKYTNVGDEKLFFFKPLDSYDKYLPIEYPMFFDFIEKTMEEILVDSLGYFTGVDYDYKLTNTNEFLFRYFGIPEITSIDRRNNKNLPEELAFHIGNIQDCLILQKKLSVITPDFQLCIFNYPNKKYISYAEASEIIGYDFLSDSIFINAPQNPDDFSAENIEINGKINKRFLFLNPGDEFTEEFNLIAFQVMGANYNFIWNDTKSPSTIHWGNYYEKDSGKWKQYEAHLPEKIGEYYLFDGDFIVNPKILRLETN